MKKNLIVSTLIATTVLAGCTTYDLESRTPAQRVSDSRDAVIREFVSTPAVSVRELDTPYLDMRPVPAPKVRGPLTLNAVKAPFGPLIAEAARTNGYSVMFADNVDVNRRVTIALDGAEVVEGLRMLAFLAGYVAVVNQADRTVIVSDTATFTYKVPPHLLQKLQAAYQVGGDPVSNEGGGGGAAGSAPSISSNMSAEFIVSGEAGVNADSVRALITNLAGPNAEVMVSDTGLISVRANAQAQRRVHNFLKSYVQDAMSQVEIEASIVEVSLNDEFELGIDWSRVIDPKSISGSVGRLTLGAVGNNIQPVGSLVNPQLLAAPTLTATFTTQNISTIVSALRKVTDAKVVSNPRILAVNNSPATFFDGTQLPYLGSVTATPTSAGGSLTTTQVTGSASYAVDGISFSVQPSIIDDNRVQITLVPVLSSVLAFEELDLGNGQGKLTAPRQANKQSFMKVVAESGKTLILGGIRYSVDQKTSTPAPFFLGGKQRTKGAKEIVILMRATVLRAEEFDPLVAEAI